MMSIYMNSDLKTMDLVGKKLYSSMLGQHGDLTSTMRKEEVMPGRLQSRFHFVFFLFYIRVQMSVNFEAAFQILLKSLSFLFF